MLKGAQREETKTEPKNQMTKYICDTCDHYNYMHALVGHPYHKNGMRATPDIHSTLWRSMLLKATSVFKILDLLSIGIVFRMPRIVNH